MSSFHDTTRSPAKSAGAMVVGLPLRGVRVFKPFVWLEVASVKMAFSRLTHQRVTQAVSPLNSIAMQTLRYSNCVMIIIVGVMILSACTAGQLNNNGSSTLPPEKAPTLSSTQPTRTASATRTPKIDRETPIPIVFTPTLDIANYAKSWTRYHGNYGISFEYPSVYGEKPYNDRCKAVESWDGADFGEKNEVYVRQPLGTTLNEHVELFLTNLHREQPLEIESQEEIEINKRPAIVIKYKLVEEAERLELVFITVSGSELIYTFSFIGGSACDMPEIGLSERTVFEHAVETFYYEE